MLDFVWLTFDKSVFQLFSIVLQICRIQVCVQYVVIMTVDSLRPFPHQNIDFLDDSCWLSKGFVKRVQTATAI